MRKTTPTLIGIASVIPGLGLWLLGKRKQAIITVLLMFSLIFLFLFSPWEILYTISCNTAVFLWGAQIAYAIYEARLQDKIATGKAIAAKETVPVDYIPAHIPRREKIVYKAKEMLRQQINAGEYLEAGIFAQSMSVWGGISTYKQYYIGLLSDRLIFAGLDFIGKPANIQYIAFDDIKNLRIKQGWLTDNFILSLKNQETIKLKVPRNFRKEIALFQEKLSV